MSYAYVFVTVPTPSVTLSAPKDQPVGQSLKLKCNITAVRGITSRVDIIWSSDGLELQRTKKVNVTSMTSYSVLYTDSYSIPQLSTAEEGKTYECTVLVISTLPVMAANTVTLNVTGKYNYITPVYSDYCYCE